MSSGVDSGPVVKSSALITAVATKVADAPSPLEEQTASPSIQAEMSNLNVEIALQDNAAKVMDCYETWEKAVGRIQWVMNSLSSIVELHPYAKLAVALLLVIPKTILMQAQFDMKIKALLDAIHDAFDFTQEASLLQNAKPESKQANILILMLGHVGNCCDFIQSYARDKNFWIRFLKNVGGEADKQISDLCSTFVDLRRSFLDYASLATEVSVFQIMDDVGVLSAQVTGISASLDQINVQLSGQISDLDLEQKMGEIPYRTPWRSGMERNCIPGTRTDFLDYISNWVTDPDSKRGLVLFGQAGTGKSSIAHEIARRFRAMNRLTSYFTFLRAERTQRQDYLLFTTIVHDLCHRYPSFKKALGKVIRNNKPLRTAQQYDPLFESMLLRPLKDVHIVGPVFIVVDGLDESGDVNGLDGLHRFLADHLEQLPANFRVLITSRLESQIVDQFKRFETTFDIVGMDDDKLAARTNDDIRLYLQHKLPRDIFEQYGDSLVKKAEGLFQWAAVASGFINSPPAGLSSADFLSGLLVNPADANELRPDLISSPLTTLYKQVLEGCFKSDFVLGQFRSVVGQLLAAFEPLSIQSLITLHQCSMDGCDDSHDHDDSVFAIVGQLGSLLSNVTSTDRTLSIVPLHTSFRDFLTDQQLSGAFHVDLDSAHHQLARSCLGLMLENLRFNICELPSSYYPNDKIDDLPSRIDKHISPALYYACCFWADHLQRVRFEGDVLTQVRMFLEGKFLFWFEVLSLKSSVGLATPTLSSLAAWLAHRSVDSGDGSKALEEFVIDANSFVRYFGMAIARSAPHIYVSALPFTPTSSQVSRQYSPLLPNTLSFIRGQLSQWPTVEVRIVAQSPCLSVAFSTDGQRIVSGLWNFTICLWNTTTGQMEGNPLTGHTGPVYSVAFSTDGQRIVSGSKDGTIRVWNATTRRMEGSPFFSNTGPVNSVAFSTDGQWIASGSDEIHVWNVTTGKMEDRTFTGHTDTINSVAFSVDGQRIVSGSWDGTVRVWNATTGQMEGNPFTGHAGPVNSVAFSMDGQRVVSGSNDCTIREWSVITGRMQGSPFTGHAGPVNSVVFSTDGQRIVSGSEDGTICGWNATTGRMEGKPFTGHAGSVRSVACSMNGQRIVSGSWDSTIRVWNAATGQPASPFTAHTGPVNSVAFSMDEHRIVSGSYDRTIHVWNAATGEREGCPFTGHTARINSVGFSTDGKWIVSGSDDRTIRVWNVATGQMEGSPFIGHTDSVKSVAFTTDGQRVISGSWDGTIRLWNAATGQMEGSPFTGHTGRVKSVACSKNGQWIVSGSDDHTVRVWNVTTGEMEGSPLTGHLGPVNSVAFSTDGHRIVSGSEDATIRVWNATTGQMEGSPFTGHTDSVSSVTFSTDGQWIVSGSWDRTIRVWNASTGEMEGRSFIGHTGSVNSVAFSKDGHRIVSGSYDRTVRVWNAFPKTRTAARDFDHLPFYDDSTIDEDGWIHAISTDELLLWIPPVHRACLHRPSNVWISGERETRLNFSNFVHGREWATGYKSK